jgi:hypothetical protein
LAAGQLPPTSADEEQWDMIVCSFALHLLTEPSELFALLDELSRRATWLVIVAPHKKPEVRPVASRTADCQRRTDAQLVPFPTCTASLHFTCSHFPDLPLVTQIKETWGWSRWDMAAWQPAGDKLYAHGRRDDEDETELEIVRDK